MESRVYPAILQTLKSGGRFSKYDMASKVFCHMRTAQSILKELHELGVIHISGWATIYKTKIPEYSWGTARDVKKPKPIPKKVKMRQVRKDPEYAMKEMMQKRALRALEKKMVSDWWEKRKNHAS